tara:strand:+ start:404 stop:655 length:252 start_codon:yes stop_codon:yes gene_type:complete
MDINPKQFVESNSKDESLFLHNRDQFGKEDDDPLSIKDVSSSVLGIILAIMTMFFPIISVLLERPLLPKNEANHKEMVKKHGY